MADHNNPQSRDEEILIATIDGTEYNKPPQSRMEELLLELKEVIEAGSGGGGIRPIGVTTTPLYDGATTNPIQINGESYTAETGDMVTYQSTEFLFNVNEVWQELGDVSAVLAIIDDIFADIAPAFNATSTYAVGDYVIYNDQLYKCDTAHTGAWAAADFTATSLSEEIKNNKGPVYTAGKYINIDANNEIKVNPVVPNEAFNYVLQQIADYTIKVTKSVNNVVVSEETYGPPTTWDAPVDVTLDEAINIYISLVGNLFYELLIASDSHESGFKQTMSWFGRDTYTENFSTVDHSGEKLVIKSELDTAIGTIKDGQSIDSFADVETALANKQAALTAGDYISIDANNEISVNREIPSVSASYELKTTSTSDPDINTDVIKRVNGEIVWTQNYNYQTVRDNPVTIDDVFVLSYSGQWKYKLLVASDDHAAGYEQTWGWSAWVDYTENFSLVDNTGKKLIIKEELDIALTSKQNATDNNLQTIDKTVVGAVNELKSGLTNYENQNNLNLEVPNRKNILPMTVADIKSLNGGASSWSGNDKTINGVTFTILTDSDGNFTGVRANGTASEAISFNIRHGLSFLQTGVGYVLTGCPSDGGADAYKLDCWGAPTDYGSGASFTGKPGGDDVRIHIVSGYAADNLVFYPMIRPATITDATFAPYIPSVESRIEAVESGLTNLNNRTYYTTTWVDFSYYNAGQLSGTYTVPTLPTGWSYRIVSVSNIFPNSELGVKLSGKYLHNTTNREIRAVGTSFESTDTISILVLFEIYKL